MLCYVIPSAMDLGIMARAVIYEVAHSLLANKQQIMRCDSFSLLANSPVQHCHTDMLMPNISISCCDWLAVMKMNIIATEWTDDVCMIHHRLEYCNKHLKRIVEADIMEKF